MLTFSQHQKEHGLAVEHLRNACIDFESVLNDETYAHKRYLLDNQEYFSLLKPKNTEDDRIRMLLQQYSVAYEYFVVYKSEYQGLLEETVILHQDFNLYHKTPPIIRVSHDQIKQITDLRESLSLQLQKIGHVRDDAYKQFALLEKRNNKNQTKSCGQDLRRGTLAGFVDSVKAHDAEKDLKIICHPGLRYVTASSEKSLLYDKEYLAYKTVIVDSSVAKVLAGMESIRMGFPENVELYEWLGIRKLPQEVTTFFCDEMKIQDGATVAKFHDYGNGKYVIHTSQRKIDSLEGGLESMASTYKSILNEYFAAVESGIIKSNTSLRMIPMGTGNVLISDKSLRTAMNAASVSSLALAFTRSSFEHVQMLDPNLFELCVPEEVASLVYNRILQEKVSILQKYHVDPETKGRLDRKNASYNWVRFANGKEPRMQRLLSAYSTMLSTWHNGYETEKDELDLSSVDEMVYGTELFDSKDRERELSQRANPQHDTQIYWAEPKDYTVIQVARQLGKDKSKTVAAINAASGYSAGGGMLKGGRHVLEEAWCMSSTLLRSLNQGFHLSESQGKLATGSPTNSNQTPGSPINSNHTRGSPTNSNQTSLSVPKEGSTQRPSAAEASSPNSKSPSKSSSLGVPTRSNSKGKSGVRKSVTLNGTASRHTIRRTLLQPFKNKNAGEFAEYGHCYLPTGTVLKSPNVEIFRYGTNRGYEFLEEPVQIGGVISCAAFNLNPNVRDSPVDAPTEMSEYFTKVKEKWLSIVAASLALQSDVLILPDLGCGVFQNDPEIVGNALKEVIKSHGSFFKEIHLIGLPSFIEAAVGNNMNLPHIHQYKGANDEELFELQAAPTLKNNFFTTFFTDVFKKKDKKKLQRSATDPAELRTSPLPRYNGPDASLIPRASNSPQPSTTNPVPSDKPHISFKLVEPLDEEQIPDGRNSISSLISSRSLFPSAGPMAHLMPVSNTSGSGEKPVEDELAYGRKSILTQGRKTYLSVARMSHSSDESPDSLGSDHTPGVSGLGPRRNAVQRVTYFDMAPELHEFTPTSMKSDDNISSQSIEIEVGLGKKGQISGKVSYISATLYSSLTDPNSPSRLQGLSSPRNDDVTYNIVVEGGEEGAVEDELTYGRKSIYTQGRRTYLSVARMSSSSDDSDRSLESDGLPVVSGSGSRRLAIQRATYFDREPSNISTADTPPGSSTPMSAPAGTSTSVVSPYMAEHFKKMHSRDQNVQRSRSVNSLENLNITTRLSQFSDNSDSTPRSYIAGLYRDLPSAFTYNVPIYLDEEGNAHFKEGFEVGSSDQTSAQIFSSTPEASGGGPPPSFYVDEKVRELGLVEDPLSLSPSSGTTGSGTPDRRKAQPVRGTLSWRIEDENHTNSWNDPWKCITDENYTCGAMCGGGLNKENKDDSHNFTTTLANPTYAHKSRTLIQPRKLVAEPEFEDPMDLE